MRALGRSAIGEAELEVRSWYDSHPGGRAGARSGFPPDGQGNGLRREGGMFPVKQATELLRYKCSEFSVSFFVVFSKDVLSAASKVPSVKDTADSV